MIIYNGTVTKRKPNWLVINLTQPRNWWAKWSSSLSSNWKYMKKSNNKKNHRKKWKGATAKIKKKTARHESYSKNAIFWSNYGSFYETCDKWQQQRDIKTRKIMKCNENNWNCGGQKAVPKGYPCTHTNRFKPNELKLDPMRELERTVYSDKIIKFWFKWLEFQFSPNNLLFYFSLSLSLTLFK